MSTLAYNGENCLLDSEKCLPPPPDLCGCEPECPEPCACSPRSTKTRARDAINVMPSEIGRWFSLKEWGCKGHAIPAIVNCIVMVIRRKGACRDMGRITPVRATGDANVEFRWPDWFKNAKPGYYEGDILINGCEQHTVLLLLDPADAMVDGTGAVEDPYPCADDCGNDCNCYAAPDAGPVEPVTCQPEGCETC